MFIHVRRESGLAHRSFVLRPWQVQVLRVLASKWALAIGLAGVASWAYFAVQAARVPFLQRRITQMEQDALRLNTLERTLAELQARYRQVQGMLSARGAAGARVARPTTEARGVKGGRDPVAPSATDSTSRKKPE
jgi:biopolymer transport protein ExbB/TolQ